MSKIQSIKDESLKAKDLRIGNWVMYNNKPVPIHRIDDLSALDEIGYKGSVTVPEYLGDKLYSYRGVWLAKIQGIPLSSEWLLKAGFEDIGEIHPTFKLENYIIEADLMREYYILRQILNKEDSLVICSRLDFVHQLQNVYHTLKRKELIFKNMIDGK
jgi:hypothetical protein